MSKAYQCSPRVGIRLEDLTVIVAQSQALTFDWVGKIHQNNPKSQQKWPVMNLITSLKKICNQNMVLFFWVGT